MDDAPDFPPQQYGVRLCRAFGLLTAGAVLHVLLPQQSVLLLPEVAPQQFVYVHPGGGDAALHVERTMVFAPRVGDRDRERRAGVAPAMSLGSVGSDMAISLTGESAADAEVVPTGTFGLNTDLPAAAPEARDVAPIAVPVDDGRSVSLPQIALVAPAVLRTPDGAARPPAPVRKADAPVAEGSHAIESANEDEKALVRQLLEEYRGAYERLDVVAAKAVFPSLDGKALKRAFGQLSSQRMTLQSCGITISGSTANARCQGSATYHPKIGTRAMQVGGEWTFDLSKKDAAWQIVNTSVH